jgi:hypothetical protein
MEVIVLAIFFLLFLIVIFLNDLRVNRLMKMKHEKEIKEEKDEIFKIIVKLNSFKYLYLSSRGTISKKKEVIRDLFNIYKQMFERKYCSDRSIPLFVSSIKKPDNWLKLNPEGNFEDIVIENLSKTCIKFEDWIVSASDLDIQNVFEQFRDFLTTCIYDAEDKLKSEYERL